MNILILQGPNLNLLGLQSANNQKRLDQLTIEFLIKVYCVSNTYFTIIKCS